MIVYIIIAAAVLIAAVIIYGAVFRRIIYKEVDQLEKRKTTIANQQVAEEIAKVKTLTMSGETEVKFEKWRDEWDEILEDHLPNIDETLFDIEEQANKYRFRSAREMLSMVDRQLQGIDEMIHTIFVEVEELIHSEEESREGITEIRARFLEMQKFISQNWRSLGSTATTFEAHLNELKEALAQFDVETEAGNYIKANHILKELGAQVTQEQTKLKQVPVLFIEIESDLPKEIQEAVDGMKEMETAGYELSHYDFHHQLQEIRRELPELYKSVGDLELDRVQGRIVEIRDYVDYIYDTLEAEAEARLFVEENIISVKKDMEDLVERLDDLEEEREKVKVSYRVPEEEEKKQQKAEEAMEESLKKWRVFMDLQENQKLPFIGLKSNLLEIQKDVKRIDHAVRQSRELLYTLREDELKALETLKEQRRKVLNDRMTLQRAMLPKIPASLLHELEEAGERLDAAWAAIEEMPVEMGNVNKLVGEAEQFVTKMHQQLRATMKQAKLAERAIQYGNKYRRHSEAVDEALEAAEDYFRRGYYDEAVTAAVQAIEKLDPNVLTNISGEN
ncbi:septation ring formation regulator EzrA [Bacillus piscicola]|uniref:septation ring formation regulator EzrA n=1 Tax=Bacillus piscicola TaxID=1632684 RepID=UPI001F091091|nr:septation ring formation regulator EzrA [Bacillus piscicola]